MSRLGRRVPNTPLLFGPASAAAWTTGTLAATLAPVTASAFVLVYPAGTLAKTLSPVTLAAAGTHFAANSAKIRGTIWTKTLTGAGGSETFTASAVDEAALAFVVLHGATAVDVSATATGTTDIADSPSVTTTQPDEMVLWAHFRDAHVITVLPGSGTNVGPQASSANAVRSSVAVNVQTQTVAGTSGTRRFSGAAADAWAAATISITGTSGLITGTVAQTLAPVTLAAVGTFSQFAAGTVNVTLGPVTMSSFGFHTPLTPVTSTHTLRGELTSFPRLRQGFSHPRWG